MTKTHIDLDTITDTDRFREALNALLRAAHASDIPLERAFACPNDDRYPNWDVHIIRTTASAGGASTTTGEK